MKFLKIQTILILAEKFIISFQIYATTGKILSAILDLATSVNFFFQNRDEFSYFWIFQNFLNIWTIILYEKWVNRGEGSNDIQWTKLFWGSFHENCAQKKRRAKISNKLYFYRVPTENISNLVIIKCFEKCGNKMKRIRKKRQILRGKNSIRCKNT